MTHTIYLLVIFALLSGCGGTTGDPDQTAPEASSTTQVPATTLTQITTSAPPQAGDGGWATIKLDDITHNFASFNCAIGHDQTAALGEEYEDLSFVGFTGMIDGNELIISISDLDHLGRLTPPIEGPGIQNGWWIEVQLTSVGDEVRGWASTNAGGPNDVSLQFDGSRVEGSGFFYTFDEEHEGEQAAGTFEAECG